MKSIGNIVSLMDGLYKFELPPLPKEEDIWYYNVPKSEQYWKTTADNKFKWLDNKGEIRNVKQMPERDKIEYINYWRDKWENGLWFMNNGIPTYITGMHVEHLVFNKFKSTYFYYLEAQKERFYFRELTNREDSCDGRCWVKGRRVGITAEEITESIRCLISDFSNSVGVQSDTHPKAKSTILKPVIEAYIKRPKWMRENFYSSNGKIPIASLELKDTVLSEDQNYPLGGTFRAFPTTPMALDGEEFMLVVMDETSKWPDVSPYETFEKNKKTIINPGKRGKMDLLSTTGDSKEAAKAVKEWHKLISDSNPKILNENGKTNSGLWYYFVSYTCSHELIEEIWKIKKYHIKDKFGFIDKAYAEEYIWNDVKKHPKDSKEYIHALYKSPMELRHALLTPTGQGYFSKTRITNRLDELRAMPNDRKPYVRGVLEEDSKGKVWFKSDAERQKEKDTENELTGKYEAMEPGRWLVAMQPYFSAEKNIDTRNRYRVSAEGVNFPPINPEYGAGYDPMRYRKEDTTSTSLSDACIVVFKKFDYFGAGDANRFAALYLFRPNDPHDANKEAIKACKFWGCPMMHERVIESVKEDFNEANMLPFLAKNENDGKHGIWIDSQGKIVKNGVDMLVTMMMSPKTPEDIDQIAEMPFEDVLADMDLFDIGNTTAFDVFMAMIEMVHCLKQIQFTNASDNSTQSFMNILLQINPPRN